MKKLAPREEQIMHVLWDIGPSFIKEIVEKLPEPKPHYNSVSTMVRILETKGFIGHKEFGKSHQYHAILPKDDYQSNAVNDLLGRYFNNSFSEMVAYFAKKEEINDEELDKIINLIKNKKS